MSKINRNILLLYCITIFRSLIFAYCIERLFAQSRGLRVIDIAALECIYAIGVSLLEIPSGWLADKFTRKSMMVVAAFSGFIEIGVILGAHSFYAFALAIMVSAVGGACRSGSRNALLYDSLLQLSRQAEFERIYAKMAFFDKVAAGAAALLGSMYIAGFGLEWNYKVSLVSYFLVVLFSCLLTEPKIKSISEENQRIVGSAWHFLKKSPWLTAALMYGALLSATMIYVDEFWQYYFQNLGVKVFFFGMIGCLAMLASAVGELAGASLDKTMGRGRLYFLIYAVYIASFLGLSFSKVWYLGLFFMLLAYFCTSAAEPVVFSSLHHAADSNFRATAESFQSLFTRTLTIVFGVIFGYVAQAFDISAGFLAVAVLILLTMPLIFTWIKRRHNA